MAEAFEELTVDPVTMRPMLYPHKLFGRFYEISTLARLLDAPTPSCPFSRRPFVAANIEKPNRFERQFFDLVKNAARVNHSDLNATKHAFILFCRSHAWNVEGAELGDVDCTVGAALDALSGNRPDEAKRWASKAAKVGSLFAVDVLGHTAMLQQDFAGAHEHFARCWAAPAWATKGTTYHIAECYFERDMYKHALRWAYRAIDLGETTEAITLSAQICYLRGKFFKCVVMAERAMRENMLAAFIYAMCCLRQVGKFKGKPHAIKAGSELMHKLRSEGYVEAGRFLNDQFIFDTVRNANRNVFRHI